MQMQWARLDVDFDPGAAPNPRLQIHTSPNHPCWLSWLFSNHPWLAIVHEPGTGDPPFVCVVSGVLDQLLVEMPLFLVVPLILVASI